MWEARNWMKRNEPFLPTWHAYVGYRLDLFEKLSRGMSIDQVISEYGYEDNLLRSWADTGVVLDHLKKNGEQLIPSKQMMRFFTQKSEDAIGELLKEMFEMHMPVLMNYPDMIKTKRKSSFNGDHFGKTVAATSALIEKRAFPHVVKELQLRKPEWVLDIGCGTGGYLMKLARKMNRGTYAGVDISKDVIDIAREKAKKYGLDQKVRFYYADINKWDVPDGLFDIVMMNNLLHYYSPDTRADLFARVAQLLSPKGTAVVITPLYLEKGGRRFSAAFNSFMEAHDNLYPLPKRKELVQDAKAAGLKLKAVKTVVREGSWYCMSFSKKKV
ncbi:hypothetical protein BTO28_12445 [Domibacillus epiphyticus]|uniref:Methyltransferase domain-containing protein n=2 Tax=Domibacillus epiphyticus TaxID=1714355 RepID=A0A1V2A696_9BACI|nr:hypothetical protein BTO28_12445 [Domibacillus epiphyticus]